jgi:hypothetical protein
VRHRSQRFGQAQPIPLHQAPDILSRSKRSSVRPVIVTSARRLEIEQPRAVDAGQRPLRRARIAAIGGRARRSDTATTPSASRSPRRETRRGHAPCDRRARRCNRDDRVVAQAEQPICQLAIAVAVAHRYSVALFWRWKVQESNPDAVAPPGFRRRCPPTRASPSESYSRRESHPHRRIESAPS